MSEPQGSQDRGLSVGASGTDVVLNPFDLLVFACVVRRFPRVQPERLTGGDMMPDVFENSVW